MFGKWFWIGLVAFAMIIVCAVMEGIVKSNGSPIPFWLIATHFVSIVMFLIGYWKEVVSGQIKNLWSHHLSVAVVCVVV